MTPTARRVATSRKPSSSAAPASAKAKVDKTSADGRIFLSSERLSSPGVHRPRTAETLLAISEAVGSRGGLVEALRQTTAVLARALGADVGSLWLLDAHNRDLEHASELRLPDNLHPAALMTGMVTKQVLADALHGTTGPIYSGDSARDRRFTQSLFGPLQHRSMLIQPLRVRRQVAGAFVFIWTRARHRFSQSQLRMVDSVTEHTGLVIENTELLEDVQQLNQQLEKRVRDRTARLKHAYEELRVSRAELRAVAVHRERVRECERARISREIHDELGQALTGLKLELQLNEHRGAAVSRPLGMIDEMIDTVRRIASELRPRMLDDLGLLAAVEWHARQFEGRTGVKCRLRATGDFDRVDVERTTALFRIFQEVMTNIARHSGATRVLITLTAGRASVRLTVRDNGVGLRLPVSGQRRLGILGMQERAAAFGGRVTVSSTPPKGTAVHARVPVARTVPRQDQS
jgi:signal transduction histidine kinase